MHRNSHIHVWGFSSPHLWTLCLLLLTKLWSSPIQVDHEAEEKYKGSNLRTKQNGQNKQKCHHKSLEWRKTLISDNNNVCLTNRSVVRHLLQLLHYIYVQQLKREQILKDTDKLRVSLLPSTVGWSLSSTEDVFPVWFSSKCHLCGQQVDWGEVVVIMVDIYSPELPLLLHQPHLVLLRHGQERHLYHECYVKNNS